MFTFLEKIFSSEPKTRAHLTVKGRIFDGSFHILAEQQARARKLKGWLKVRDGLSSTAFIELEIEGPDSAVKDYIMDLRKGNRDSNITNVIVDGKPVGKPPFSGFSRTL